MSFIVMWTNKCTNNFKYLKRTEHCVKHLPLGWHSPSQSSTLFILRSRQLMASPEHDEAVYQCHWSSLLLGIDIHLHHDCQEFVGKGTQCSYFIYNLHRIKVAKPCKIPLAENFVICLAISVNLLSIFARRLKHTFLFGFFFRDWKGILQEGFKGPYNGV